MLPKETLRDRVAIITENLENLQIDGGQWLAGFCREACAEVSGTIRVHFALRVLYNKGNDE